MAPRPDRAGLLVFAIACGLSGGISGFLLGFVTGGWLT